MLATPMPSSAPINKVANRYRQSFAPEPKVLTSERTRCHPSHYFLILVVEETLQVSISLSPDLVEEVSEHLHHCNLLDNAFHEIEVIED